MNADHGIDELHAAWTSAIRRGDIEAALVLLTSDYVLWAPSSLPITGRDAVRALFTAAMAAYELDPQFQSEERLVSGDLAVERGWDIQTIRPRAGGDSETRRQRVFLVMQRDGEGKWYYARGISQPGPLPAS